MVVVSLSYDVNMFYHILACVMLHGFSPTVYIYSPVDNL